MLFPHTERILEYWNSLWNTGHLTVLNTLFQDLMKGILTNPVFLGVWSPWKGRVIIPNLLSQCRCLLSYFPAAVEAWVTCYNLCPSPHHPVLNSPEAQLLLQNLLLKLFGFTLLEMCFQVKIHFHSCRGNDRRKPRPMYISNWFHPQLPSCLCRKIGLLPCGAFNYWNWHCTSRDMRCLWQVRNVPKITPSGDKMKSRLYFLGALFHCSKNSPITETRNTF